MLNVMKYYKFIFSRQTLKKIYIYHVKSILNYGDILSPKLNAVLTKKIEDVQYQACLTICGAIRGSSKQKMLKELDFIPLDEERNIHCLCNLYKIDKQIAPEYLNALKPAYKRPYEEANRENLRRIGGRDPGPLDFEPVKGPKFLMDGCMAHSSVRWNLLSTATRRIDKLSTFRSKIKNELNPKGADRPFFNCGDRRLSILHCRLILGICGLNKDLFTRNLIDSPLCPCGNDEETVRHLFLDCTLHSEIRDDLFLFINQSGIGWNCTFEMLNPMTKLSWLLYGSSMKSLEWNTEMFLEIQHFILESDRFLVV
jgi:hypothetical protein